MDVVGNIFEVIGAVISNLATAVGDALTSITTLFYNAETGFTFVGVLLLIAVGAALFWGAWALIKALIRQRVN